MNTLPHLRIRARFGATGLGGALLAAAWLAACGDPASAQTSSARSKDGACVPSTYRVILDVGHTADAPGALSARGVTEYSFNMQLADTIKQALLDAGFDQTVKLVTAIPPWSGLVARAMGANRAHADLLIAIHHDSVPDYLLETWQYEGQEHRYSDRFSGHAIFMSKGNGDPKGSLAFGHLLGKELLKSGLHYTPHYTSPIMRRYRHELLDPEAGVYRYDQLVVLRYARMPAVLLEAGSIVNRQEELELGTPERRQTIAKAVAAAVADFCAARSPAATRQVNAPAVGAPLAH